LNFARFTLGKFLPNLFFWGDVIVYNLRVVTPYIFLRPTGTEHV